jgi:general secretion pathway protein L
MNVEAIARRWIDILASLWLGWRERRRARNWLKIIDQGDGLLVRQADGTEQRIAGGLGSDVSLSDGLARRAKHAFVIFEPRADEIVSRRMTVPARARELLPGIVRNQIERVSPWRASQAAFGFDVRESEDPTSLDIRILIMPRAQLDDACARIASLGLQVDAVMVGEGSSEAATGVTLWSRLADASGTYMQRVRRMTGGLITAMVCLGVVVSGWAFWSAASAAAESDDIGGQIATLQRQIRGSRSPQSIEALPPPERAWAMKENSLVAAIAIEALSRVLPDGAYLTELNIDGATVRLVGVAQDAPALIAPLEQSGHFTDVHFFAPTTRSADGVRFIFHIEALAEPHTAISGG